jgi:hypothetical protein
MENLNQGMENLNHFDVFSLLPRVNYSLQDFRVTYGSWYAAAANAACFGRGLRITGFLRLVGMVS